MRVRGSIRAGAVLVAMAMLLPLAGPAAAATPDGGQVNDAERTVSYEGGPFVAPNRSDPLFDGSTLQCLPDLAPCDDFALTVALPDDYLATHPDSSVKVALRAFDASQNRGSDYDLYVLDANGDYIAVADNAGTTESVEFPALNGTHTYTVRAVPFSSRAVAYSAQVTLLATDSTRDSDGDGVADVDDDCPGTPSGAVVDATGCSGTEVAIPSDPDRPRVIVADIDSAINPYHDFYYQRPSSVTQEVLDELGVKPENVVRLTRTGDFASDRFADAGFWARVERGELYHFAGTNIIATSLAVEGEDEPYLKPTTAKNPHGVGTSAAVLTANPDAIILFIEANNALGSAETHAAAFQNPAVDIVTTSYGVSVGFGLVPLPEYRAFEHSYEGVVSRGKLHFSSGGNGPGVTALRAGAGPWWSIGVSGIEEGSSEGDTLLSGNLPDFVSDFTQTLPYCMDCESGTTSVSGTSFSTPRSAGLASRVLLETRRTLKHKRGIRSVDGKPVMATNVPRGKGAAAKKCSQGACASVTNWQLRRALEQAAWTPDSLDYDPAQATGGGIGLPMGAGHPVAADGVGRSTTAEAKGVHSAALGELSALSGYAFGGMRRVKPVGYCEYQTQVILARKAWWDEVAPTLPDNPELTGETPPGAPAQDPFVYCDTAVAAP